MITNENQVESNKESSTSEHRLVHPPKVRASPESTATIKRKVWGIERPLEEHRAQFCCTAQSVPSVEHGVPVVDVPALLLHLPLPLVLLLADLVEHTAARAPCPLLYRQGLLHVQLLVDVLLVGGAASVEQRVEAHEEEHVDGEEGDDPDDEDDQHADGSGVAALVAALATGAELALTALDIHRLRQHHALAVAPWRGHIADVELADGRVALDNGRARADALAADILVLRVRIADDSCQDAHNPE